MSLRGIFDFAAKEAGYRKSRKMWHITPISVDCFWFDLIINPPKHLKMKESIVKYLSEYKKRIESTLEKRFIYFLASRTKLRFDTRRPPHFEYLSGKLAVNFLVGKNEKRVTKKLLLDHIVRHARMNARFTLTDKFLTIWWSPERSDTFSVHDFAQVFKIEFGINTQVHYVGITKNPHDRPISLEHRGLNLLLYNIPRDDNDFFLFVNIFKVMARTLDKQSPIVFNASNAMIDELPAGREGAIIEHSLVAYFDSRIQDEEKSKERATLIANLEKFKTENNLVGVLFDMELEEHQEYFCFFSDKVEAADRHVFTCRVEDRRLVIDRHEIDFDVENHFSGSYAEWQPPQSAS
jgi:hypothetical protein